MNNAVTRGAIKAALDTVSGVKGYARKPDTVAAFDAWPLWRGAERAENAGFSYVQTWAVVVALSQGDVTLADSFVDVHGETLVDALEKHVMTVLDMAPAIVATSAGDMNALMITGRCE